MGLALICVALGGCVRMDEAALRAHMAQWFALGPTMGFGAKQDCAAAAFRLVDTEVGSALAVVNSVPKAVNILQLRGTVALDQPDVAPDEGLVELINTDRALGYQMRRAALEGRVCMDEITASAFGYALTNPQAVLAFDASLGALMLLDPGTNVLIVAMGEG